MDEVEKRGIAKGTSDTSLTTSLTIIRSRLVVGRMTLNHLTEVRILGTEQKSISIFRVRLEVGQTALNRLTAVRISASEHEIITIHSKLVSAMQNDEANLRRD